MYNSNLNSNRGQSKGHLSGFDEYRRLILKILENRIDSSTTASVQEEICDPYVVRINYSTPAALQLEKNILEIMNYAMDDMQCLISNPNLNADNKSPFLRRSKSAEGLLGC